MEIENEAKWLASRDAKDKKALRLSELRSQIRGHEAQLKGLRSVSPEAAVLVDQWMQNAQGHADNLVYELKGRLSNGKTPSLNFSSPDLIAYLLGDLAREKFAELAERVVGGKSINREQRNTQCHILEDELLQLRQEYCSLAGV